MERDNFFDVYEKLTTRAKQKRIRYEIISRCEIKKVTFYSWLQRGSVPDEKNRAIIANIMELPEPELFSDEKYK